MGLFGEQSTPPESATATTNDTSILIDNVVCDSTVFVGAVVKMISNVAYNAKADTWANSGAIGICESKQSSTLCTVRVAGLSAAIYVGLDDTKSYMLDASTAGALTTTPPSSSGNVVLHIGRAFSPTRLIVQKLLPMVRA